MKREFKSGEVVLEVYDASLRIVMDHLLPPYEENGECSYTINISGNDGMATGGSGDVLSGMITSLMAQGMDCFEAAKLGVYIHGLAGDKAADEKTRYSMVAGDIIKNIPVLLSHLL